MRRTWVTAVGVLALGLFGSIAQAADHRDGATTALADPTIDITDVYAWLSADGTKVYLVMDIQGANTGAVAGTKFSNAALYAFHVTSGAKYGDPAAKENLIICKFDAQSTQGFQCWAPGGEYVADVTGNATGKTSSSGKLKAAALLRNDPFFFNIRGFRAAGGAIKAAAGGLMIDAAGCPKVDMATSNALVGVLKSDGAGGAGKDDFGPGGAAPPQPMTTTNGNVLSIVIAVDKTVLTTNGTMLGIWGSTNKAQ